MPAVPDNFARHIGNVFKDAGLEWLKRLPTIIAHCERQWSLTALAPVKNLSYNYIAPAIRADGTEVILKIGVPNPELTTEIEALLIYNGQGSVQILEIDREQGAFLLEQLRPGALLTTIADDEEATRIAARVMRRLWKPAPPNHPFPTVNLWAAGLDRMRHHFDGTTGPLPTALVEKAERLFSELLNTMAAPVLLHGDLHHENILSATRQPWLAIDPKGIVGEPAYEAGALLRNMLPQLRQQPRPDRIMARRADVLSEELGFDRDHLLAWGLAQAVLAAWWCVEDNTEGWQNFIQLAELIDEVMTV